MIILFHANDQTCWNIPSSIKDNNSILNYIRGFFLVNNSVTVLARNSKTNESSLSLLQNYFASIQPCSLIHCTDWRSFQLKLIDRLCRLRVPNKFLILQSWNRKKIEY